VRRNAGEVSMTKGTMAGKVQKTKKNGAGTDARAVPRAAAEGTEMPFSGEYETTTDLACTSVPRVDRSCSRQTPPDAGCGWPSQKPAAGGCR
jgi:peptide methionine sulfoxide reductase MsrB